MKREVTEATRRRRAERLALAQHDVTMHRLLGILPPAMTHSAQLRRLRDAQELAAGAAFDVEFARAIAAPAVPRDMRDTVRPAGLRRAG